MFFSDILLTLSANPLIFPTNSCTLGISISPIVIAVSCTLLFKLVSCPLRLSCIIAAIFSAVPSQLAIALDNLSMSPGAAFISARKPDIASVPTKELAALAFSDSDSFPNASLQSANISDKLLIEPSAFVVFITTSPRASPTILISPVSDDITFRNVVPACAPLIPLLAISPVASAVSSMLYPKAPATGAAYLNVSPIIDTFVLAFDEAAAKTSAKCPESSAVNPKAVSASVTISLVVAKSSPDAAAKFIIPARPSIISDVFHPAIAIYPIASPASVALNLVAAPISRALSFNASKSFAVASDIAATLLIALS